MSKRLVVAMIFALILIVPLIPAIRNQPVEARSLSLPDPISNSNSEEIRLNGPRDSTPDGNSVNLGRDAPQEGKPTSNRISFRSYGEDRFSLTYYFAWPRVEHASPSDRSSQYFTVAVDDLPKLAEAGSPVLPFETARILIPTGKQMANLSIIGGKKDFLPGTYLVEFGHSPVSLDQADSANPSQADSRNETIYSSSEPFPGTLYSGFSVQRKMGYDILLMNLFPVEYIPKTGSLFYYEDITVTVDTISRTAADSVSRRYSLQVETVRNFVDNPEVIQPNDSGISESTYQYVIITSEELANTPGPYNFQALRDDKISRGIPARIVTTEWVYANYNGTRPDGGQDDQTKIRNFIIDAYQNWGIMYVLLGGDGDGNGTKGDTRNSAIPHRGFCIDPYDEKDIPADLYYGCLDGTFDYNANGLYGEPNDGPGGGEVDLLAEVYVGRACVDSVAEVQDFVRKTLAYQNTLANENLRKAWMVGEFLGFGGVADWGGNYKDEIKNGSDAHGYSTIGFLDSPYGQKFDLSTLYDRDYPGNNWPKSEIINVINSNVNLINHLGHANVNYVMKMSNPDVDNSLVNDQYFIGYSQGCYCGAFDNRTTTPGLYSTDDCISEHLTVGTHGAAAFIANSRYGYGERNSTDGPSQHFDRQFWDAVLGEDLLNVGIANQDSKEDNVGRINQYCDRWCYYEINLFGDPELKIRLPPVPEHDLDVDLQVPIYSRLGDSLSLNATVRNRGLQNESQVKLSLMVDGAVVQNTTIDELVRGASFAMNCMWTPTTEAVYNVTAYVEPVPGENETANNAQSSIILVHASSLLIVNDNDGYSFINGTSLAAFRSAILNAGHNCLVWNESSMGNPPLDVLTRFNLIVWTCGDYWNTAVDSVDSASLQSYLDEGGNLLLEGEDIGYNHQSDNFLVKVTHSIYRVDNANSSGLIVAAQSHPITQGLPASFTWASDPVYPDGVEAANLGIEILRYLGTNWAAVTAFEGKSSKIAYYAFPLYCLGTIERKTLVANSISWLLKSPRIYNWIDSRPISNSSENEQRPAIATDSTGKLYAAFEHYNAVSGFYYIWVSQTTDYGNTWSVLQMVSDTHSLGNPSIAIDVGDIDNVYVTFEREWTSADHDIFVLRRVGGAWFVTPVANYLGNDDRFPSITCEYQYGSADRQYISFEYVYSYDDRDVMFASSQDDGASWSLKKLHGGWPDYNVHCQTSIATTRGSDGNDIIYVAYKWGADYATAYDIVIDRSKDRGSTWAQKWVCDESSRDKNWPSIAATHGGGTVVIAWHVYWDSTFLNDIQYAYSTDNGDFWSNSWLAMDPYVDEKTPAVVVDGQESTSSEMYGRIHIAYWRNTQIYYWEAPFDAPWSWTPKEKVSDPATYASAVYTKPCITVSRTEDGSYLPVIGWTDLRGSSYDIYYSTKAPATVHNVNTCLYYLTIQKAIDASETLGGHTIIAEAGLYCESLKINKSISLVGEDREKTILECPTSAQNTIQIFANNVNITNFTLRNTYGNFTRNVVNINACNVNVNGLTIQSNGTTLPNDTGIYANGASSGNNVSGNIITGNRIGIRLDSSSNNTISGNNVTNNEYGLYLVLSSNNNINGNIIATNNFTGIYLSSSFGNNISYNNAANDGQYGIYLYSSSCNTVSGNYATANTYGIWLSSSNNNTVSGNNATANIGVGIFLDSSSTNTVSANRATANNNGIDLFSSSNNNTVSGNNATANGFGICLSLSSDNIIIGNNATANSANGVYLSNSSRTIITANSIANSNNGIDLYSASNNKIVANDLTTNNYAGVHLDSSNDNIISENNVTSNRNGVFLESSGNNTISGNSVTNNTYGTYLASSSNNSVIGNTITNNGNGTYLDYSSNNSISGNNIEANTNAGIYLYYSSNNTVSGNNATSNPYFAILLFAYSNSNNVTGNTVTNNDRGISLYYCSNNSACGNNITSNKNGVILHGSDNNTISGNNVVNNGQFGIYIYYSSNNTASGNNATANGATGIMLDYDSNNNSVSGNSITANDVTGIHIYSSSNNSVSGNSITNNGQGIGSYLSSNNTISGNRIAANNGYGISLTSSSGNSIYHNNFMNNNGGGQQAYSDNPNVWDDGYPSGGNYWSDCNRTDLYRGPGQNITGSDGIGDISYVIDGNNQDNYPLMKPYPWVAHDIGITNVQTSQSIVEEGSSASINVNVMIFNYGSDTETFNVTILANQVTIGEIYNVTLTSKNFTNLTFTWNTTGVACGTYYISAHASPVPGETDTADNTFSDGFVLIFPATNGGGGGKMPYMD